MTVLYSDSTVECDDDAITIRNYYFPGVSKRIPYSRIREATSRSMDMWTGRLRLWGTGDFRHWYPLDTARVNKSTAIIIDKGDAIRAVVTPDDSAAVLRILRDKMAG
ncbi:MAG: hypothetical protein JNM40_02630 [Myxococcales bacterium]|nr:hypothetical protein [Myxococcales bacterium]